MEHLPKSHRRVTTPQQLKLPTESQPNRWIPAVIYSRPPFHLACRAMEKKPPGGSDNGVTAGWRPAGPVGLQADLPDMLQPWQGRRGAGWGGGGTPPQAPCLPPGLPFGLPPSSLRQGLAARPIRAMSCAQASARSQGAVTPLQPPSGPPPGSGW